MDNPALLVRKAYRVYEALPVNVVLKESLALLDRRERREKWVHEDCLGHGAFRASLESQLRLSFLLRRPYLLRHLHRRQLAARSLPAGQRPALLLHRRQQPGQRLQDL